MSNAPRWSTVTGDIWATHWRELEQGLAGVAAPLDAAIAAAAPPGPFRALDIGCGAGSTSLVLAQARPDASIVACDLSPALVAVARGRLADTSVTVVHGDAEDVAAREGPFDLVVSRHGVMFFADPVRAFRAFRVAARPGAKLVFSCFEDWAGNAWASHLSEAAAGRPVDPPGREPGGFAFANPDHVRSILGPAGWIAVEKTRIDFRYCAGRGPDAVEQALSLLSAVGPASMILRDLDGEELEQAMQRMRSAIERHADGGEVSFPAAASLWTAHSGA